MQMKSILTGFKKGGNGIFLVVDEEAVLRISINCNMHGQDLLQDTEAAFVEYVYIRCQDTRELASKTKYIHGKVEDLKDVPEFYCSDHPHKEKILVPVAMYRDPFRRGPHKIVLCEGYKQNGKPARFSFRYGCAKTSSNPEVKKAEPCVGIEQEYFMLDSNRRPLGWHKEITTHEARIMNFPVGSLPKGTRDMFEEHLAACVYAGVHLYGGVHESLIGQWEFQVGPCHPVKAGDDIYIARYLLQRLSEKYQIPVTFDPSPIVGACSGGHINFSTKQMREEGGLRFIRDAMPKLEKSNDSFLPLCDPLGGQDNQKRFDGLYSRPPQKFAWGESKVSSVRIPFTVVRNGKGYFEDRRPAANFDPYVVVDALMRIVIMGETDVSSLSSAGLKMENEVTEKATNGSHLPDTN